MFIILIQNMENVQSTNLSIKCTVCHHIYKTPINKDRSLPSLCQKCFHALKNPEFRGPPRRQTKRKNSQGSCRQKLTQFIIEKEKKKRCKSRQQCALPDKKTNNWQEQMENDIFQGLEAPLTEDGEVKFLQFYSFLEGILNE